MKNRILIITRNFPPLVGGMEKLMRHTYDELRTNYQCSLIGPSGCSHEVTPPDLAVECPTTPVSAFLLSSFAKSAWSGWQDDFAFCLAGSGITAPMAMIVKAMAGLPVITFVHGLDLIAESRVYQQFFIPAIRKSDLVIANSRNTALLAAAKGVSPERIEILHPGVKIPANRPEAENTFRENHGLTGKKILLSVGRLVPRKGLAEFIEHSFSGILSARPETTLVIIGQEPRHSLKKEHGVLENIKRLIQEKQLTQHVLLLGDVSDAVLADAYQAADLFLFPVKEVSGDVEGFGMVATEAAAYGLPTLAFKAGGVPDAVRHQYSGFLIENGRYQEMTDTAVRYFAGLEKGVSAENCRAFAAHFSWQNFGIRLRELCANLIDRHAKQALK